MAKNKEEKKSFAELAAELDKKFSGNTNTEHFDLSTGSLSLDLALGGGVRSGRITELIAWEGAGKTTICLHLIAEAQKKGLNVAYIDAEHALDEKYAKAIGVDWEKLKPTLFQPMNGEDAFQYGQELLKTGELQLLIFDSTSGMLPKSQMEAEPGGSNMGKHALLFSKEVPKVNIFAANNNAIVVFVSQLREKIGIMFGCFHYDTIVNFADGRSIPIGKVVDEKITGDVYTLNEKTGSIEIKPIVDWHDNGKINHIDDFISFITNSLDGKGKYGITCTKNHELLTSGNVWKKAKDITIEDKLVSKYLEKINGSLAEFLQGSFIGDCSLKKNKNKGYFSYQDNENLEYVRWKINKLSPFFKFTTVKIKSGIRYDSEQSTELLKIKEKIVNRDPLYLLNNFSPLGMAILYMDDGHYDNKKSHNRALISFKRFKNNQYVLDIILEKFKSIFGENISINYKNGNMSFHKDTTTKLFEMIHIYIPECMQYKLHENFRNKYIDFSLSNNAIWKSEVVNILDISVGSKRKFRNKRKFDISIQDNHNYMVGSLHNGIFVHNSPETTQAGNTLKFFASNRIDLRRSLEKEGDEVIGINTKFKVLKCKTSAPYKTGIIPILFGVGIDKVSEIIEMATDLDLIKKWGKTITILDGSETKYDLEEFKTLLKDNEEFFQDLRNKIIKTVKNNENNS